MQTMQTANWPAGRSRENFNPHDERNGCGLGILSALSILAAVVPEDNESGRMAKPFGDGETQF
ncbi:MAG: hypothetical protein WBG17_05975 [Burkholderiaceae bacterium]